MKTKLALYAGALALVLAVVLTYQKWFRYAVMPEPDLFSAAQLAANQGNCEQAVDYYQALLKKDPRHSVALDFMADCQVRLGDVKGAISTREKLILLEPVDRYKLKLAGLYQQVGQNEKAALLLKELKSEATGK